MNRKNRSALKSVRGHSLYWNCLMRQFCWRAVNKFCVRQWFSNGVQPKQAEVAWEGIRNHSSMRLQQYRYLDHCIEFHEQRKHWRKIPLQEKVEKHWCIWWVGFDDLRSEQCSTHGLKDFFQEGHCWVFFQNFSEGWGKVAKFVFFLSKLEKRLFLLNFPKSSGALPLLPTPATSHSRTVCITFGGNLRAMGWSKGSSFNKDHRILPHSTALLSSQPHLNIKLSTWSRHKAGLCAAGLNALLRENNVYYYEMSHALKLYN